MFQPESNSQEAETNDTRPHESGSIREVMHLLYHRKTVFTGRQLWQVSLKDTDCKYTLSFNINETTFGCPYTFDV